VDRTFQQKVAMAAPLVVFDLDGTLVDTAPDLVASLNMILARERLPPVAYEAGRNMVGGGARVMIERGLAAAGRSVAAPELDGMVQDFVEHYAAHIADASRPFPGVETALDALTAQGCRLAVCTNKLEWLSVKLLDTLGLSGRFDAICGPDTFGVAKPKPEILHCTISRCRGKACVMVGDSLTDIATARAAGVPVIAVDFGYTETPVAELAPDRVVSSFAEVPPAVFSLAGAPVRQFP
jgi:phosphoglycolate phosphatase